MVPSSISADTWQQSCSGGMVSGPVGICGVGDPACAWGCMDPAAPNYNASATSADSSCVTACHNGPLPVEASSNPAWLNYSSGEDGASCSWRLQCAEAGRAARACNSIDAKGCTRTRGRSGRSPAPTRTLVTHRAGHCGDYELEAAAAPRAHRRAFSRRGTWRLRLPVLSPRQVRCACTGRGGRRGLNGRMRPSRRAAPSGEAARTG